MFKRMTAPTGEIADGSSRPDDTPDRVVRSAILVHSGPKGSEATLASSDGDITFDENRIKSVVENHNKKIAELGLQYGGLDKMPIGAYPPILDQHSDDSNDRIRGRLTGLLRFVVRDVPKVGKQVACAVCDITFLGADTVSKVKDGRIYHLSVGIDEASDTLGEVSTVIDPAAPGAMVLKGNKKMSAVANGTVVKTYKVGSAKIEIHQDSSGMFGALVTFADGKQRSNGQDFRDQKGAEAYANQAAAAGPLNRNKGAKQMKLNAEIKAGLKALKSELTKATAGVAAAKKVAHLAKRKSLVKEKFTKLMASKKITPGEFRKLDVARLAKLDKDGLEIVLHGYEAREPQVMAGQQGTKSASSFTDIGTKSSEDMEVMRLKAAVKRSMLSKGTKFLAAGDDDEKDLAAPEQKDLAGDDDEKELAEVGAEEISEVAPEGADAADQMKMIEENAAQIARVASMLDAVIEKIGGLQDEGQDDAPEEDAQLSKDKNDDEEKGAE